MEDKTQEPPLQPEQFTKVQQVAADLAVVMVLVVAVLVVLHLTLGPTEQILEVDTVRILV
ncbi:MAG: hypothetical protein EBZ74_13290 [Planctomycetia bacterium]|nr:hypothetical protein [Planctomycetia bacterium]